MTDSELDIIIKILNAKEAGNDIDELRKKFSAFMQTIDGASKVISSIDGLSTSIQNLNKNMGVDKYISFNEELYKTGLTAGKTINTIDAYSSSMQKLSKEIGTSRESFVKLQGQMQLTIGLAKMSAGELNNVSRLLQDAGKSDEGRNAILNTLQKFSDSPELFAKLASGMANAEDFKYAQMTLARQGDIGGQQNLQMLQAAGGGAGKDMTDRSQIVARQRLQAAQEDRELKVAEASVKFTDNVFKFGTWLEKFLEANAGLVSGAKGAKEAWDVAAPIGQATASFLGPMMASRTAASAAASAAGTAGTAGLTAAITPLLPAIVGIVAASAIIIGGANIIAGKAIDEAHKSKESAKEQSEDAIKRGYFKSTGEQKGGVGSTGGVVGWFKDWLGLNADAEYGANVRGTGVKSENRITNTSAIAANKAYADEMENIKIMENKTKHLNLQQSVLLKNADIAKASGAGERELQTYSKAELPILKEKLELANQELARTEYSRTADPAAYQRAIDNQQNIIKGIREATIESNLYKLSVEQTATLELNPVRIANIQATTGSMRDQLRLTRDMIAAETQSVEGNLKAKPKILADLRATGATQLEIQNKTIELDKVIASGAQRANEMKLAMATKYDTTGGMDTTKFQWTKDALNAVSDLQTTLPTALGTMLETRKGLYQMALAERDTAYEGYQLAIKNGESEAVIQAKKMDYLGKSNTAAQEFMKMTGGLTDQIQSALGELNEISGGFDETAPKLAEQGALVKAQLGELYAPQFKYGSFGGESQDIMNTKISTFTSSSSKGLGTAESMLDEATKSKNNIADMTAAWTAAMNNQPAVKIEGY